LKKKIAADAKEAYKIALKAAKKEGKDKEFKAKAKQEKQQAHLYNIFIVDSNTIKHIMNLKRIILIVIPISNIIYIEF